MGARRNRHCRVRAWRSTKRAGRIEHQIWWAALHSACIGAASVKIW
jgi:hypothetical protein